MQKKNALENVSGKCKQGCNLGGSSLGDLWIRKKQSANLRQNFKNRWMMYSSFPFTALKPSTVTSKVGTEKWEDAIFYRKHDLAVSRLAREKHIIILGLVKKEQILDHF